MVLAGKPVLFRLSPDGKLALKGLFQRAGVFRALVLEEDELGLWVRLGTGPLKGTSQPVAVLLKWHYFSTALVDWQPEVVRPKRRAGFR